MSLPFTTDQFFAVFARYNTGVWPAQLALAALALAGVAAAHRPSRLPGFILALLWIWMAVAYHLAFFSAINPAAWLFAAVFALQALGLAWAAWRNRLEIRIPRERGRAVVGWALLAYALIGYPAAALLAGQRYPAMPTFGLPCPTTIYTLALLAWTVRPAPWLLLAIPAGWSVIGTSAALQLGVPEDFGLAVATLAVLAQRGRLRAIRHRPASAAAPPRPVRRPA